MSRPPDFPKDLLLTESSQTPAKFDYCSNTMGGVIFVSGTSDRRLSDSGGVHCCFLGGLGGWVREEQASSF